MTRGATLHFVSAGMLTPKKQDNPLARQHRYLNYGLLGLATIASKAGYSCRVVHGLFDTPEEVAHRLVDDYKICDRQPLFLSMPSNFAITWAQAFVKSIRSKLPEIQIIAGGRWVIGEDYLWLKKVIPEIDLVVAGTCESRIVALISSCSRSAVLGTHLLPANPNQFRDQLGPILDYSLLENPSEFQPSIEVSRGCGMGCSFCAEKDILLSPLRYPNDIVRSVIELSAILERDDVHPYFECSFFRPTRQWSLNLKQAQNDSAVSFYWRTESRVDSFTDETLDALAVSGLKVLDVGLESASVRQLLRMNKTTNPKSYLKKASRLVKRCSSLGIWVKVNVLLYAGENCDTIAETCDWLEAHRNYIKGVSVNPLIAYRTSVTDRTFLIELANQGASLESENDLETKGFSFVHLSKEIDANEAKQYCPRISRRFMSGKDYFDLKAFSYFKQDFRFDEFMTLASSGKLESLPFEIDPIHAHKA